jgi:hypothetical protein
MNSNRLASAVLLVTILALAPLSATGTTDDFKNVPVGVFDIEYDQGHVVRLKIKGEAEVSSAVSPAKANRLARDKAMRDAKSHFSRWLREEVTVVEMAEEIVVVAEVNGESTANVIDTSSTRYQSVSQSLLRGITVLYEEGDGERYTMVLGWSHKLANATEDVSNQIENPGAIRDGENAAPDSSGSPEKVKRKAKNIDDF